MDILIDLYQQQRINEARNKADQAKSAAEQMQWEIKDLKRKADALTIACQALWEIVRTQTGMRDEAILQRMQEIDARDGRIDGRISTTLATCPKCSRKNNANRRSCLYCGATLPVEHVFEKDR